MQLKDIQVQNFQTESALSSRALKFKVWRMTIFNCHTLGLKESKTTTSSLKAPPYPSSFPEPSKKGNSALHPESTSFPHQMNAHFSVMSHDAKSTHGTQCSPYTGDNVCLLKICLLNIELFTNIKGWVFHINKIQISSLLKNRQFWQYSPVHRFAT